ncbi:hypothetical protein [Fischerella sp. PCC 9605]|uniref:hypothetical protein n=1 Tax=Fischerella sp. PCC 9605 TaxID=1173024 RepID=UPI0018CC3D22|nr:hypothetical protein [Fischerella sp. PCC 9605]
MLDATGAKIPLTCESASSLTTLLFAVCFARYVIAHAHDHLKLCQRGKDIRCTADPVFRSVYQQLELAEFETTKGLLCIDSIGHNRIPDFDWLGFYKRRSRKFSRLERSHDCCDEFILLFSRLIDKPFNRLRQHLLCLK